MEFSRQEYWIGLPFHSPGNLPDPGIEPMSFIATSALAGRFFTTSSTWEEPPQSTSYTEITHFLPLLLPFFLVVLNSHFFFILYSLSL